MAKTNAVLHAFNRGEVGAQSLARIDIDRMRLSAEEQVNWLPRTLGPMRLRPGLGHIAGTKSDAFAVLIPFIFSATQTALLECTAGFFRPLVDEAPITRASVSTTIANGTFTSSASWTTGGDAGTTATFTGQLTMTALPISSSVTVTQTVTVAGGDQNVEHAVRVVVARGPIRFRIGSTSGGDELFSQTDLGRGEHSLAFTPTNADVYIQFECLTSRSAIVTSIAIEASGQVSFAADWTAAQLRLLRWAQSGDVVFLAENAYRQRKIERRSTRSWSLVWYETNDGPFQAYPKDDRIKMWSTVATGNGLLRSSRAYFESTHVGALFRLFTTGYNLPFDISSADTFSPAIRITGVGTSRQISITRAGTWAGTLYLQESYDSEDAGFTDVATHSYTGNGTTTYTNSQDNAIVYLRIGFKTGTYTSGTATVTLAYGASGSTTSAGSATVAKKSAGGRSGVCRVTAVNSATECQMEVLKIFSSDVPSENWYEGEWSDISGWPSAVTFHEGRLFWAGKDRIWGSVSDNYYSFDPTIEGESGPIQRSIGFGPVQIINWLLPMSRLMIGAESSEVAVRSSSFDEPLTPTNFSLKDISTYGSARVGAVKIDTRGTFVDRTKQRLLELAYQIETNDYRVRDLTILHPDLNLSNPIVQVVVQRQPDTRIHCIREDGTVAVLVYEPAEEVICWWKIETDGVIESAAILPDDVEDAVYYTVKRTINGAEKRFIEKFAREDEAACVNLNKSADSFIAYTGASTATITGLSHLEGETVVAWGDGADLGTFTVASGQITLSSAVTNCVVGLTYQARFKSTKLAYAASMGTALVQKKRVNYLGVVLHDTHKNGLQYGPDYTNLDELPLIEDGVETDADATWDHYDKPAFEFNGSWDTDSRVCLVANAPRPCTILGAVIGVATHDKA
jgi:hypothetical protein